MKIIAIDIGTTHCKAIVVNERAEVLQTFQSANRTIEPAPGWNEQSPEEIFTSVASLLRQALNSCERKDVSCVSFSAAMHSLIALDNLGKPLMNMLTWADLRSARYARELKGKAIAQKLYETTGVPMHAMSPLCKLIWLRNEAPDIFSNAHKFISIKEFIFFRLFGKYVVDHSIAAATGMFDEKKLCWCEDAIHLAGINQQQLSELFPVEHYETELLPDMKKQLHIENTIPFVLGGSDGALANLGCAAIHPREAAITIGTSGAVRVVTRNYSPDKKQRLFCYYLEDGMYLTGGAVNSGGHVLKWFAEKILGQNLDSESKFQSLLNDALRTVPGGNGLIFLPYISGERSPMWDENARGVFIGLSSVHTKAHLTRAVIEGICFALCDVLQAVEETTGAVENIFLSGGVVRSDAWVQLLANITGKKIFVNEAADASALGAAFIGMKAVSILDALKNVPSFVNDVKTFQPDTGEHMLYKKYFEVYRDQYRKFKETFDAIKDLPGFEADKLAERNK